MKKDGILLIVAGLLYAFIQLGDALTPTRIFSETENRRLAQKPAFSLQAAADGSYQSAYETCVTDQFPWRDSWVKLMAEIERASGKKDINGVWLAPGNTLMEMHRAETVDEKKAMHTVSRLMEEAHSIQQEIKGTAAVLLAPGAAAVQPERLPPFAVEFDQAGFLGQAEQEAGKAGILYVNAYAALQKHAEEPVYYGTDHHWTTLGAFYAYQAMEEAFGRPEPQLENYERTAVTGSFLGTLQARVNLSVAADTIEIFRRNGEGEHPVSFIPENRRAVSCYFYERLQTRDAYAFFLDGNGPLLEMEGDEALQADILVIKDSYANCFVPFLTKDYGRILVLDKRYYRGDIVALVQKLQPDDVLYLYSIFGLMDNF